MHLQFLLGCAGGAAAANSPTVSGSPTPLSSSEEKNPHNTRRLMLQVISNKPGMQLPPFSRRETTKGGKTEGAENSGRCLLPDRMQPGNHRI